MFFLAVGDVDSKSYVVGYTNIILWEFRDYLLGDERHHRN